MVDLPEVPRRLVTSQAPTMNADPGAGLVMLGRGVSQFGAALMDRAEQQKSATEAATAARNDGEVDRRKAEGLIQFKNDPVGYDNFMKAFGDELAARQDSPRLKAAVTRSVEGARSSGYGHLLLQNDQRMTKENTEALTARVGDLSNQMTALAAAGKLGTPEYLEARQKVGAIYDQLVGNPALAFPREKADRDLANLDSRLKAHALTGQVERVYKAEGFAAAETMADTIRTDPALNLNEQERQHYYSAAMATIRQTETERRVAAKEFDKEASEILPAIRSGAATDDQVRDFLTRAAGAGATNSVSRVMMAWGVRTSTDAIMRLPGAQRARALISDATGGAVPRFSGEVETAIDAAAAATGVDADTLRRFAKIESGGRAGPEATTGSYKGLFQLSDAEFAKHGGGNIFSASDNAMAAARKLRAEAGAFEAKYGRQPTPGDLYMIHQQGEAGYAAHMANPSAPAWQNMASTGEGRQKGDAWARAAIWGNIPDQVKARFGSVDNVTSAEFVGYWKSRVEGGNWQGGDIVSAPARSAGGVRGRGIKAVPGEDSAAVSGGGTGGGAGDVRAAGASSQVHPEVMRQVVNRTRQELPPLFEGLERAVSHLQNPAKSDVDDLVAMVGLAGTDKDKERLANLMASAEAISMGTQMTADQRAASVAGWRQKIAEGATIQEQKIAETVTKSLDEVNKGYREKPYETGALTGITPPSPVLNPVNTAEFKAGLDLRMREQAVIRTHEGLPAFSAFNGADRAAVNMALSAGDVRVTGSVLSMVANLDPEVAGATLREMKDTIQALARTTDPALYNATFQALNIYASKPEVGVEGLARTFNQEVARDYQTWRGRYQYMRPDEMKAALVQDRDPARGGIRAKLRQDAMQEMTEASSKTKVDLPIVLGAFDDRWLSNPAAPMAENGYEGVPAERLMSDWRLLYAERRGDGMTHDQAVTDANERIKTRWGTTDVGGRWRIQEFPPEKQPAYRDLSASEMKGRLETDLRAWFEVAHPKLGSPAPERGAAGSTPGTRVANQDAPARPLDYVLFPTSRTEADAANGRPPAYHVGVILPDGRVDVMRNVDGTVRDYDWGAMAREKAGLMKSGYFEQQKWRATVKGEPAVRKKLFDPAERARAMEAMQGWRDGGPEPEATGQGLPQHPDRPGPGASDNDAATSDMRAFDETQGSGERLF